METSVDKISINGDLKSYLKSEPKQIINIERNLKEMSCAIRPRLAQLVVKTLDQIFPFVYDNMDLAFPKNFALGEFVKNHRVVFVANHQSHADYMVFNYLLCKHFGIIPYTAGGINLKIFPLAHLFRALGCIFIRRSFSNDPAYKLTLTSYLQELLSKSDHPLEFYYEGGRSRNGMLLTPKFGLFQMLISAYQNVLKNQNVDSKPLVFLPAAIVHDRLPEQSSLARETQIWTKKKPESLAQPETSKLLRKRFGTVHIRIESYFL